MHLCTYSFMLRFSLHACVGKCLDETFKDSVLQGSQHNCNARCRRFHHCTSPRFQERHDLSRHHLSILNKEHYTPLFYSVFSLLQFVPMEGVQFLKLNCIIFYFYLVISQILAIIIITTINRIVQ